MGELARLQPRLPNGVPHAVAVAVVAQLLLLGCARGRLQARQVRSWATGSQRMHNLHRLHPVTTGLVVGPNVAISPPS